MLVNNLLTLVSLFATAVLAVPVPAPEPVPEPAPIAAPEPAPLLEVAPVKVERVLDERGLAFSDLFPKGETSRSWSTSQSAQNTVQFSTGALGATNVMNLPHPVVAAPDGKTGMRAHFNKGAVAYKGPKGGLSMLLKGPDDVDLTTAKEATLGYRVFFQDGFDFNKGGKLPGFYGGANPSVARICSGGRKPNTCFSTRMMWRRNADAELYAYLPPGESANKRVCKIKNSHCNPAYGSSVARGSFKWKTGRWTTVAQRVKLNDPGKANGEIEIFADGESVIKATGLVLRTTSSGRIFGVMFQTFFGGHDSSWSSRKNQDLWFSDISVAITERL